jgi:hypothetical protein
MVEDVQLVYPMGQGKEQTHGMIPVRLIVVLVGQGAQLAFLVHPQVKFACPMSQGVWQLFLASYEFLQGGWIHLEEPHQCLMGTLQVRLMGH